MENTKEWNLINPEKKLSQRDFLVLFEHLPLNVLEIAKLKDEYWEMYLKFINSDIEPKICWMAARNLFINKEPQIGERIDNEKKLQTLDSK